VAETVVPPALLSVGQDVSGRLEPLELPGRVGTVVDVRMPSLRLLAKRADDRLVVGVPGNTQNTLERRFHTRPTSANSIASDINPSLISANESSGFRSGLVEIDVLSPGDTLEDRPAALFVDVVQQAVDESLQQVGTDAEVDELDATAGHDDVDVPLASVGFGHPHVGPVVGSFGGFGEDVFRHITEERDASA
jgi:hypothetical protein